MLNFAVAFWAKLKAELDAHRPFLNIQFVIKFDDGLETHVRTSEVPVFDSNNNFEGYRGTIASKALQINPALKVVIMTGYAEKTVSEDNASNMSFPILNKPF